VAADVARRLVPNNATNSRKPYMSEVASDAANAAAAAAATAIAAAISIATADAVAVAAVAALAVGAAAAIALASAIAAIDQGPSRLVIGDAADAGATA
jgi:hypothetical protein